MSEDRNGKTYSFDVCSKCKLICCQGANPPLTNPRKKTIETYLDEKKVFFRNFFVKEDYAHPAADAEDFCILYSRENIKCRVHPVKPETCRAGPVTFDINRRTRKVEWFLKNAELCLFAGKLFEAPEQLDEHLKVAKEEITCLICKLDSAALRAILKIDEPQIFKIGEDPLPKEVLEKLGIE